MPAAVMNVLLLVVDLALARRPGARGSVCSRSSRVIVVCGDGVGVLGHHFGSLFEAVPVDAADRRARAAATQTTSTMRYGEPRPASRWPTASHSVWISRRRPSSRIDRPRPSSDGAGRAHPEPPAGALERAERLLLGVGLDEVDDVGDRRRVVVGVALGAVRGRRHGGGSITLRCRPSRPCIGSAEPEAEHRLDVVEALGEQVEALGRRRGAQQAVAVGRAERRQRGEVVRRDERVVADTASRSTSAGTSPSCGGERRAPRRSRAVSSATRAGEPGGVGVVVRPVVDVGQRVRVVGQPGVDADPPGADGDDGVAAVVERARPGPSGRRRRRRPAGRRRRPRCPARSASRRTRGRRCRRRGSR